jgi:REP element-mobilizing transposase RayT
LYATALGDSRVIGLAFNRTESLTQARLHVAQCCRRLSTSPVREPVPVISPFAEVEFETTPELEVEKTTEEPVAEVGQEPSPEVQTWVDHLEVEKLEEAATVVEIPARSKTRMVTGRLNRFTGPSETGAPSLLDRILHSGGKDQKVEMLEEQQTPAQNESEEEEVGSVSLDDLLSQESGITPEPVPGVRPEWIEEIANAPATSEEAQEEEWRQVLNQLEPEDHSHEAPTQRLVLGLPPAVVEEQNVTEFPGEMLPDIYDTSASQSLFPMPIQLEEEEFEPSDPLSETNPHVFTDPSAPLEAGAPGSIFLNNKIFYTFLLVPALPRHYLTGELAEQLGFWLPQLCEGFGWSLQGLAVRPEYLLWTMELERSVSPASMARIIRQQTSQRVLSIFAELKEQVARDDFWAPGCLIIRGSQSPSPQLLQDFVRQTRRRQQILTSLRENDLSS